MYSLRILAAVILLGLQFTSCETEITCQCTSYFSDGSEVDSEPYTISVGECSDANSNLDGIIVDCVEIN